MEPGNSTPGNRSSRRWVEVTLRTSWTATTAHYSKNRSRGPGRSPGAASRCATVAARPIRPAQHRSRNKPRSCSPPFVPAFSGSSSWPWCRPAPSSRTTSTASASKSSERSRKTPTASCRSSDSGCRRTRRKPRAAAGCWPASPRSRRCSRHPRGCSRRSWARRRSTRTWPSSISRALSSPARCLPRAKSASATGRSSGRPWPPGSSRRASSA